MESNSILWYITSIVFVVAFSATLPLGSMYHIPASLVVLLICFKISHVVIYIGTISILIIQERYIKKSRYKPYVLMITNIGILLGFKIYIQNCARDITGPLMILTQKSYYLGSYEFESFTSKLKYLFFVPSILAGPVILPDTTREKIDMRKAMYLLYISLAYAIIYISFVNTNIKNIVDSNCYLRIPYLYFYGLVRRCMFYFVWTIMQSCFLMQGYDAPCIFPFRVETASNIRCIIGSWNTYTNLWLKKSIFLPLKSYGVFYASFATFLTSAIWHGLNICYFIACITFSISIPLFKSMDDAFSGNWWWSYLSRIHLSMFIAFYAYPILSLNLENTLAVWKSVWYYGFAMSGFMLLIHIYRIYIKPARKNNSCLKTEIIAQ